MKNNKLFPALLVCVIVFGCQSNRSQQNSASDSNLFKNTTPLPDKDPRPMAEVSFLNKIKGDSDYGITSDVIKKDSHVAAFNKYALDSLKNITGWEMIVTEINDNPMSSNSVMKKIGDGNPVYNIILTAPIKIDKSVDSISNDNHVDFTYTIPKSPKGDVLKKQLDIIKTLNKGDVIIVSGALTHFDDNGKINFAPFYESYNPWNVDLLLSSISKSTLKNYGYLKKVGY